MQTKHLLTYLSTAPVLAALWMIGDADLNGAINIALLGQSVTLPRGSWLACEIAGGLQKASPF